MAHTDPVLDYEANAHLVSAQQGILKSLRQQAIGNGVAAVSNLLVVIFLGSWVSLGFVGLSLFVLFKCVERYNQQQRVLAVAHRVKAEAIEAIVLGSQQ